MAPATRKDKEPVAPAELEPALLRSTIQNREVLDKVLPMTACDHNEWGATQIWPGSRNARELEATTFPLFIHTIFAGLLPPFSDFFCAILDHYQIHALHLQPNSVLLLAIFAYLCEGFLGMMPSVALWRCFYSLRVTAGNQRSGCVSWRIADGMAEKIIDMKIVKKVEGYPLALGLRGHQAIQPPFHDPHGPGGEELRVGARQARQQEAGAARRADAGAEGRQAHGGDGRQGVYSPSYRAPPEALAPGVDDLRLRGPNAA